MEAFKERGVLEGLHVAFSRKEPGKKVYVQHLIEREAPALYGLLERGAHIYVCGDAKHMAPDVREAFAKVGALCAVFVGGGGWGWGGDRV